jgi:aminoglycoside 3'-phosphotransferase-2
MNIRSLPAQWLAGCEVEPVSGMSGAATWRLRGSGGERYVKVAAAHHGADLRQEIARSAWLAARGIRVAPLIDTFDDGATVGMLMGALPGVAPQACGLAPDEIVVAVARAFAGLHALAADECPFDETVAARLERVREDMARGAIDPTQFDERNRGRTPEQIHDRLAASVPSVEDIVVVHGDATFDNILIDGTGAVGFLDCGRAGRGDRYLDLTLLAAEIEEHFAADGVGRFLEAYGLSRWDDERATFFRDLYELF